MTTHIQHHIRDEGKKTKIKTKKHKQQQKNASIGAKRGARGKICMKTHIQKHKRKKKNICMTTHIRHHISDVGKKTYVATKKHKQRRKKRKNKSHNTQVARGKKSDNTNIPFGVGTVHLHRGVRLV